MEHNVVEELLTVDRAEISVTTRDYHVDLNFC